MIQRTLNRVQLMGYVTKEPNHRLTKNNTPYCLINLMTFTGWIDDEGEVQSKPQYHKLIAWNALATVQCTKVRIGANILVEGELRTTITKERRMINDVRVTDIWLL